PGDNRGLRRDPGGDGGAAVHERARATELRGAQAPRQPGHQLLPERLAVAVTYAFTGLRVADLESALAWYERLAGRPPDLIPNESEAAWQLMDTAWLYVVRDAERAGKALLTVLVDDLDDRLAELTERGLRTGAIDAAPGRFRRAAITDPEGNTITFAEA